MRDAAASYAAATLGLGLTLLVHGPRALAYDGHPLQWFEALMLLWIGVELFRLTGLPPMLRLLLAAGAAWLAVDELLMFHECVRWKWLGRLGGDPLVVAYALFGTLAGVLLLRAHPQRLRALPHLVAAALGVLSAVLADLHLFGVQTNAALIAEEGGEFLAVAGAVALLRAAPAVRPLGPLLWVGFSALAMFASLWLVRPWLCPPRLL